MPTTDAPSPRPSRRGVVGATVAALALGVSACASGGGGNGDADPAKAVPASAPFYTEIVVQPDGKLGTDAEAALKKMLRTNDVQGQIDKLLSSGGDNVDFKRDIRPWLGRRIGVFANTVGPAGASAALVAATTDEGKARDGLAKLARKDGSKPVKRSYKGVDYEAYGTTSDGVVDGFAVVGSDRGLKAVVDTVKGDSSQTLANAKPYKDALATLGKDDAIGSFYVDPGAFIGALSGAGGVPPQALTTLRQAVAASGAKAVAAKLGANAEALTVESATLGVKRPKGNQGDAAGTVAALPGDAWLSLGVGAIGERGRQAIQQVAQIGALAGVNPDTILQQIREQSGIDVERDLLSWMGDGAIFVRGRSLGDVGGALVIQSSNPKRTQEAITKIGRLISARSSSTTAAPLKGVAGVDRGLRLSGSGSRIAILLASAGDKFILAVGEPALQAAIKPNGKLGDASSFKDAASKLGNGIRPTFFLDVPPILSFVEATGQVQGNAQYEKAKPYLEQFAATVAGSKAEGDKTRAKLVVGLKK